MDSIHITNPYIQLEKVLTPLPINYTLYNKVDVSTVDIRYTGADIDECLLTLYIHENKLEVTDYIEFAETSSRAYLTTCSIRELKDLVKSHK